MDDQQERIYTMRTFYSCVLALIIALASITAGQATEENAWNVTLEAFLQTFEESLNFIGWEGTMERISSNLYWVEKPILLDVKMNGETGFIRYISASVYPGDVPEGEKESVSQAFTYTMYAMIWACHPGYTIDEAVLAFEKLDIGSLVNDGGRKKVDINGLTHSYTVVLPGNGNIAEISFSIYK